MVAHDLLLLERLSDKDLALLAEAAGEPGSRADRAGWLRRQPGSIDALLARPEVFDTQFGEGEGDPLLVAGPFVVFAVLLAQAPSLLAGVSFVRERIGRRATVPVFEVEPLRELVADPLRRLFLADLLASYTHVASGAIWVKSRSGWRHRRFSELDPVQFAQLIVSVPPDQRLGLYRRLGDLALFLCGVFPDHVGPGRSPAKHRRACRRWLTRVASGFWNGSASAPTALPGRPRRTATLAWCPSSAT
jgi:hypothetical protein